MRRFFLSIILKRQHIRAFQTLERDVLDVQMRSFICDLATKMQKLAISGLVASCAATMIEFEATGPPH
jgi:hypothetical protein